MTDNEHVIRNARAKLAAIREGLAALEALENGAESVELDGYPVDSEDAARDWLESEALSVEVRHGWHTPGQHDDADMEYSIVLTTGGPACRIIGYLHQHNEPGSARIEWQDWGQPWTPLHDTTDEDDDALLRFAGMFCYG